jgi:hypothetical protein
MRPPDDEKLIAEFVAAFGILDDLTLYRGDEPGPAELDDGLDDSQWARQRWKPAKIATPRAELDQFQSTYGVRFPELYENLLLSYRWREVHLGELASLFENPPGSLAGGIFEAISESPFYRTILLPSGLVPFARAPDGSDLICFDTKNRLAKRDCPLVQIDHEILYCHDQILRRAELWPTFRLFVQTVIARANETR